MPASCEFYPRLAAALSGLWSRFLQVSHVIFIKVVKDDVSQFMAQSPVQVNLLDFDVKKQAVANTEQKSQELLGSDSLCVEEKEFMDLTEGDEPLGVHEKVEKEWKFDAG